MIRKHSEHILNAINEGDDSNNPLSLLIAQKTESKIEKVIDTLPEQCRKDFICTRFEGLKYQ